MTIHVSDHALLRYLDRAMGIDVESIRRELASPTVEQAAAMGCATVKLGNGCRLKLRGQHVTTVLAKGMRLSKGEW